MSKYYAKYGVLELDAAGKVVCGFCGAAFESLGRHIQQKHGYSAAEYKEYWGLNRNTALTSALLSDKRRIFCKMIGKTVVNPKPFTKGWRGRTREVMREETRLRLTQLAKEIRG